MNAIIPVNKHLGDKIGNAVINGGHFGIIWPDELTGLRPCASIVLNLYDMHKFYAFSLMIFFRQLEQCFLIASHEDLISDDEDLIKKIGDMITGIKEECQRYGLQARADQADRVLRFLQGRDWRPIITLGRELMNCIQDDLRTFLLVAIPSTDKALFEQIQLHEETQDKFPSVIKDMGEAGKCFATERNTACVFHLMRVLEVGLRSMAKALKVQYERRQWENVINDIEASIKSIGPSFGSDWKDVQRFYSEGAIQFRHFTNAWRNHVIHNPVSYDRQEAANIFTSVREFMNHLATELEEAKSEG